MLAVMIQPAAARPVERSHEHLVETFPEDLCGVPVISSLDLILNNQQRLATSGFPLLKHTVRGRVTWTNPVTGKSIRNFFAGAIRDLTVTDNGNGTVTLRTAVSGVQEEITLSDGTVAIKDVGRIVYVDVIDYHGTLIDRTDDQVLSESIESIAGKNPEAENSTLFCTTVIAALT
jgi:hypothetical protein